MQPILLPPSPVDPTAFSERGCPPEQKPRKQRRPRHLLPPSPAPQSEPADPNEPEERRRLRQRRIAEKHARMAAQLAEKRARDEAETAEKAGKVRAVEGGERRRGCVGEPAMRHAAILPASCPNKSVPQPRTPDAIVLFPALCRRACRTSHGHGPSLTSSARRILPC